MEVRWYILFIILGSALVTVIPRTLPLMILSRLQLPSWLTRWLHYVPIAVMASLIGQELFVTDGTLTPITSNVELMAAIPTFLVAMLTRSLLGTVITGIVTVMLLRLWL